MELKDVDPIQLSAWAEAGIITNAEYIQAMSERDIVERLKHSAYAPMKSSDSDVINGKISAQLLLDAAAEITRLREMTEWRPIESAEKPQTPWVRGHARYYLGFIPDDLCDDPTLAMSVIWWEPARGWVSDADVPVKPSHYMPLPPPPQEKTDE